MPRTITITTPENVRIDYELAGIASRAGAALVDMVIQGLVIALALLVRYVLNKYGKWPGATWANAALGIGIFIVNYGYFVFFESAWNGQTPGKRYTRMRTVREGGLPIDLACAALRNLVRVVDFLPALYVLGGIVVLASSRNKRLGDYAAGTLVVKERSEWKPQQAQETPTPSQMSSVLVRNIELITPDEFAAISRFMDRQAELAENVREELASRIAGPLVARLGIEQNGRISSSALLAEIHRQCIEQRGMR